MKIAFLPHQYSQQRQKEKPVWVYPVRMAMEAEYYRKEGHNVYWEWCPPDADEVVTEPKGIDFLSLPFPDREFTLAHHSKYQLYGNYKYTPATHMQVADGCWWGKCKFCVECSNEWKIRKFDHIMEEIDDCQRLGFREIFDDSGSLPDAEWLTEFCVKLSCRKDPIVMGCNMRIDGDCDWAFMKKAGFRMILFGVESINQRSLDKINKGIKSEQIIKTLQAAANAGLEPHIAVMFGYPWESEKEELETLRFVHYCLRKGIAKTAQASLYDVSGVKAIDRGNIRRIYDAAYNLEFWFRRLGSLRDLDDVKYLIKEIKKGIKRD